MLARGRFLPVAQDLFWSFKPLAAALVIFGLWPWPLRPAKPSLVRRWPLALHILVVISNITMCAIQKDVCILGSLDLDIQGFIFIVIFVSMHLLTWLSALIVVCKSKAIIDLFEKLCIVDLKYGHNSVSRKLAWKVLLVVSLDVILYVSFIGSQTLGHGDIVRKVLSLILWIQAVVLRDLIPGQMIFVASIIAQKLKRMNNIIKSTCDTLQGTYSVYKTVATSSCHAQKTFANMCHFLMEMSLLVKQFSAVNGLVMCITYTSFVLEIVASNFLLLSLGDLPLGITVATLVIIVTRSWFVHYFTSLMDSVHEEATMSLDDLIRVGTLDLSPGCQSQVQGMIQKMSGPPIQITASNYFAINRGLLTSILGASTTYLIILVQFRGTENDQKQ